MVAMTLSLVSPSSGAVGPRVAVWIGGPADAQSTELGNRLKAELAIAGFDNVELDPNGPGDAASLEVAARNAGAFAAIAVVRKGDLDADVWVTDRVTGKAVLRRVHFPADSADAPAIFAIRAVELLHASLLELEEPQPPRGDVQPTPEVRQWVEPPTAKRPQVDYGAHAGIVVVGGPGGIPIRVAPALGIWWRPLQNWAGSFEGWGPAMSTVGVTSEGMARIDQEAVFASAQWHPLAARAVGPFARVGFGATRLGVSGHADAPYTSRSDQVWSALGVAGFGVTARASAIELGATLDTLWSTPRPAVVFSSRNVATASSPNLSAEIWVGLTW